MAVLTELVGSKWKVKVFVDTIQSRAQSVANAQWFTPTYQQMCRHIQGCQAPTCYCDH